MDENTIKFLKMFSVFFGLSGLAFIIFGNLQSAPMRKSPADAVDGRYLVGEIEIASGEHSGDRFRIARLEVGGRHGFEPADEVRFKGENKSVGFKGLGELSGIPANAKDGESGESESSFMNVGSLFSSTIPVELHEKGVETIKYRWKQLKSCAVHLENKEETDIVGDSSKGIITIPKKVTRRFTEVTKPPCFVESDREFKLTK